MANGEVGLGDPRVQNQSLQKVNPEFWDYLKEEVGGGLSEAKENLPYIGTKSQEFFSPLNALLGVGRAAYAPVTAAAKRARDVVATYPAQQGMSRALDMPAMLAGAGLGTAIELMGGIPKTYRKAGQVLGKMTKGAAPGIVRLGPGQSEAIRTRMDTAMRALAGIDPELARRLRTSPRIIEFLEAPTGMHALDPGPRGQFTALRQLEQHPGDPWQAARAQAFRKRGIAGEARVKPGIYSPAGTDVEELGHAAQEVGGRAPLEQLAKSPEARRAITALRALGYPENYPFIADELGMLPVKALYGANPVGRKVAMEASQSIYDTPKGRYLMKKSMKGKD